MVAVRCGGKGDVAEPIPERSLGEIGERQFPVFESQALLDKLINGI